jgi:hypothetical protein
MRQPHGRLSWGIKWQRWPGGVSLVKIRGSGGEERILDEFRQRHDHEHRELRADRRMNDSTGWVVDVRM